MNIKWLIVGVLCWAVGGGVEGAEDALLTAKVRQRVQEARRIARKPFDDGRFVRRLVERVWHPHSWHDFSMDPWGLAQNLTMECAEDMLLVASVHLNASAAPPLLQLAVAQMTDASVSLSNESPGSLRAPRTLHGFKQECDLVHYQIPHSLRTLVGGYSRVYVDEVALAGAASTSSCVPTLGVDVCMPASCTSDDLLIISKQLFKVGDTSPVCVIGTADMFNVSFDYKSWIVANIIIIFTLIALLAGVLDYCILPEHSVMRQVYSVKLFLAFSFYTNVKEIFSTSKATGPGQIGVFHFLRVISMFWVMISHVFDVFLVYSDNILDVITVADYPLMQLIMNGYFSVDNFFFIGSTLLSFLWFKEWKRNRGAVMSVKGWILFYVHRIIRISPPYFMAVAVYTWVYRPVNNDKPIFYTPGPQPDGCEDYFWRNFLYINNFGKREELCFGHAWYLAADMQMYVLTPVLLVTLSVQPVMGFVLAGLLIAGSTAGNIIEVYANHWPAIGGVLIPHDPQETNYPMGYQFNLYYAMWIRCQIYIMGILVGWFLQRVRRIQIPQIVNLGLWGLAIALMATPLFGLFEYNRGHQIPLFWRAMYSAFSRISWGLGLSWVTIACFHGYGGPVNRFMSWHIWIPLSRLSYTAYLLHVMIIMYVFGLHYNAFPFSCVGEVVWTYFTPTVLLTFAFALYFSCLFEVPVVKLEKLLLKPSSTTAKRAKAEIFPEFVEKVNVESVPKVTVENLKVETENGHLSLIKL